jgi:hypothetical protein
MLHRSQSRLVLFDETPVPGAGIESLDKELAGREYLAELGGPFEALVAFTGTVKDEDTGEGSRIWQNWQISSTTGPQQRQRSARDDG